MLAGEWRCMGPTVAMLAKRLAITKLWLQQAP